jgi:hypothetical protein
MFSSEREIVYPASRRLLFGLSLFLWLSSGSKRIEQGPIRLDRSLLRKWVLVPASPLLKASLMVVASDDLAPLVFAHVSEGLISLGAGHSEELGLARFSFLLFFEDLKHSDESHGLGSLDGKGCGKGESWQSSPL